MEKYPAFQKTFIALSDTAKNKIQLQKISLEIEKFMCILYGKIKCESVNQLRLVIFETKYKVKNLKENLLDNIKSFEGSSSSPCKNELEQHIRQTVYISQIWRHAHSKIPTTLRYYYRLERQKNAFF